MAFGLESYSNLFLNLNKGWFFHPDWSCLTLQKLLHWPSGAESQMDLWSQLWTFWRFTSIRVSFSSRLVLSDQSKSQLFLLLSSFCSFLFYTWIYLIASWWFYPEYFGFHRNSLSCNCVFMKIKDEIFKTQAQKNIWVMHLIIFWVWSSCLFNLFASSRYKYLGIT